MALFFNIVNDEPSAHFQTVQNVNPMVMCPDKASLPKITLSER